MGKMYPPEAVWKNVFTSPYGTIVSMSESPLEDGLLAIGTDDGLIQVTEDHGATWRAIDQFTGVPEKAYVSDLFWSQHDPGVLYATFNNHKEGDFKPYVLKSSDNGQTWNSINKNIASDHACWTIYEDHVDPNLLFLGTEFGIWCSLDGGSKWIQMKGNIPTIPVRDIEIQQRENDLVLATFGRGFYILDNYSLLRELKPAALTSGMFSIKDALLYIPQGKLGYRKKGVFGDNFYSADDPPPGVTFDIYLEKRIPSAKEIRVGNESNVYPSYDDLRKEDFSQPPAWYILITDESDRPLCQVEIANKKGHQRVAKVLRRTFQSPDGDIKLSGPSLPPGQYNAQLISETDGVVTRLGDRRDFRINALELSQEKPSSDFYTFYSDVTQTMIDARILAKRLSEEVEKMDAVKNKYRIENSDALQGQAAKRGDLLQLQYDLYGDRTLIERFEYYLPSVMHRLRRIHGNMNSSFQITETHRSSFATANEQLIKIKLKFDQIANY